MWGAFSIRVPGKWVLTGEHSVLKGANAIALPHPTFGLDLTFQPQVWSKDSPHLKVTPERAVPVVEQLLRRIEELRKSPENQGNRAQSVFARPSGSLVLESTIPVGAGLGSSAALCVAIVRWVSEVLQIQGSEAFHYARSLEDQFHGRSSGMDVAAVFAGEPVLFSMKEGAKLLDLRNLPRFTFHDTGLRARTSDCVKKVEIFRETDSLEGSRWDAQMAEATHWARHALEEYNQASIIHDTVKQKSALLHLSRSMGAARECFQAWSLIPDSVKSLEGELLSKGALATKITGAGGGGFVVALWPN